MPLRFLFFISFVWIALQVLFSIAALSMSPLNGGETDIQILLNMRVVHMQEVFLLPFKIPIPDPRFFTAIISLMAFDYPFFPNGTNWQYFRWFVLIPLSFGFGLLLITTVGPALVNVLSAVTSTFVGPIVRRLTG